MSDLIEVLQRIIMESLKASKLSDIAYGTVVSVSPVRIPVSYTHLDVYKRQQKERMMLRR